MSASNFVHLEVDRIARITEKAMLVEIAEEQYWIPLSQITDPDDYEEGDEGASISVSEWWVKKEGLTRN